MHASFSPTLKQLRAFASVYQLRKLSAAGEQLALTQSAVSVLLKQLEEGLGIQLFDRTTRSLRPTQAAHDLIITVERIVRDVGSLGAGLQEGLHQRTGRVCIAITPTLGEILLPPIVQRFEQEHPGIQLHIDDCAPDQFMARLGQEHVDFGIGTPERMAADVESETLREDQLSVLCLQTHAFAHKKQLPWKALHNQPIITIRPGYGIRPLIEMAALKAGIRLNVANEVTFLSTAVWMAEAGLAPAIMPSAYARDAAAKGMAVIALTAPKVTRNICLIQKRGRSLSAAAQLFAQVVRQSLQGKD